MSRKGIRVFSTIMIAALVTLSICAPVYAETLSPQKEFQTVSVQIPPADQEWVKVFQDVKDAILNLYPKDVTVETLYQGAIEGLFDSLEDPYSEYLDKQEFERLFEELEGEFSGIGVSIQSINDNITVVSVFKGSPAERAGIRSGDIIIAVDGVDILGKSPQDVSSLLRGDPGTQVAVTIFRPSTAETLDLNMTRAKISAYQIEVEDLGDGMFYVRIPQFASTTGEDFSLLMKIMKQKGLKGLLLDLRDNPGGFLDAAVDVAGELVPRGPIVQLRRKDMRQVIYSDKDGEPIPTVILVNGGTASASEIVAGAVRDRGKGILVGERTFGKACVQTTVSLGDDLGGFKITIADYYTPKGTGISGVGLRPNIVAKQESLTIPDPILYQRNMKQPMVGLDVLALQTSLKFLGYDPGDLDGIYGPKTEAAVISFLKDHGKKYDGAVTSEEASFINRSVAEKAVNIPDTVLAECEGILRHWLELIGN